MIEHIELKTLQNKIPIYNSTGYSNDGGNYGMGYNDEKTNPKFLQYEEDLKYAYELNRLTPHSEILYRYYNSTLWETHSKEIRDIPKKYHIIPGSPAEEMGTDFKVCWGDKYKYKWYYLEEAISNRMKTVNSNRNGIIIEPEYYLDFLREWLRSVIELYGDYKYARLFRWGYWRNINTDELLYDLNKLIDLTNIVDSYTVKDALEWGIENVDSHPSGHITNSNYKLWHNLLSKLWRGLECGLEEEVLPILKSWQSFEQRCFDNELEEQLYEFIGFKIQYCRRKVSLGWIEFQCYKQLNNKSEQIRVLDEMINLHPTLLDDLGGRIWHVKSYVSINRIFEAAILKYTLEPNAFNKLVCYNLYTYGMPQLMHEGVECSVERGITVFDYVDRVLKLDYK